MKKILIGLAIFIVLVIGAGYYFITNFIGAGVIGSIEKYEFNVSKQKLEEAVNEVFDQNIQIQKPDSLYNLEGTGYENDFFYCVVKNRNDNYIFEFSYITYKNQSSNSSVISLNTGAKLGNTLQLEQDLGFLEKKEYQNMFEDQFISKVRNQLQK